MSFDFHKFAERLNSNFNNKVKNGNLFKVDIDKDHLYDLYLNSFPEGTNGIYRVRKFYDCSCCRHFIQELGSTVFIDENLDIHTIFEFDSHEPEIQPSLDAMDEYIKSCIITGYYLNKNNKVGQKSSFERQEDGTIIEYDHFYVDLPTNAVLYRTTDTLDAALGEMNTSAQTFHRALDTITMDAVNCVLELINANSLYRGAEFKNTIKKFKEFKSKYDELDEMHKERFVWRNACGASFNVTRILNHSIGLLLQDVSNGLNLDTAVSKYEAIVAPANYKRPKAIFTKKMLDDTKAKLQELGYLNSLNRRFATIDDVAINNVLFSNKDYKTKPVTNIFDEMENDVNHKPKKFNKIEQIGIEDFINNILPSANEVEAYFEDKHRRNLVSLIAPTEPDAKSMFKWNNPFSWAYTGNIADSDIKENVKKAGGNVSGFLRFSIQWNEGEYDNSDLDAHCEEWCAGANIRHIFFGNKNPKGTNGNLDVDIIEPIRNTAAVENIVYPLRSHLKNGYTYKFSVNGYHTRNTNNGVKAEIECDGKIYSFVYNHHISTGENVSVANVVCREDGSIEVFPNLSFSENSVTHWNINTNSFIPVNMIMLSPNYWDSEHQIGNKHYMFMLKGCINDEEPNGFYNEFLNNELTEHKRVMEALGSKLAVTSADNQLSGLGFSSTQRNELVVKVKGATERVFKVKF